jgi:hypothetical protein
MVVFFCSRDKYSRLSAFKWGAVFFAVTLIVASPWYLKNYWLTSNPFYPLFGSFFTPSTQESGQGVAGLIGSGLFNTRATLYGEKLWEILLIPLRMFFQGQDNSDQYFDGKLNPILILTVPLAVFRKDHRKDSLFFLFFSLFLIFVALFRAVPRVRYIAPVIPFLTILSVVGMKELLDRSKNIKDPFRNLVLAGFFVFTTVCIGTNGLYLAAHFKTVRPMPYLLNQETKADFLKRHMASFPAIHYINNNLPSDSKVFLVFLGRRGYYLDRAYVHETGFGMKTLRRLVSASHDERAFVSRVRSLNCTHMLIRIDLLNKFLHDNYEDEDIARFSAFSKRFWKQVFRANGYEVFDIRQSAPAHLAFPPKHDERTRSTQPDRIVNDI